MINKFVVDKNWRVFLVFGRACSFCFLPQNTACVQGSEYVMFNLFIILSLINIISRFWHEAVYHLSWCQTACDLIHFPCLLMVKLNKTKSASALFIYILQVFFYVEEPHSSLTQKD